MSSEPLVDPTRRRRTNALLANVTPAGRTGLLTLLTPATLSPGDVLSEAHARIRHVYFPLDCLVSLLLPQRGHSALEVGVVGSEGMVGVPLALGAKSSLVHAVVQGAGSALKMTARAFDGELTREPALARAIGRYVNSLLAQIAQSAACNAFHPVEARCARWLLMARDRLGDDEIEITHASLAQMLGVRRVGVTVAAGSLQRRGAITYSRGRVLILDAERLGAAACECYESNRLEIQRVRSWRR